MSVLIDELIENSKSTKIKVNNKWYVAKPLGKKSFIQRYRDAIMVFGKCSGISLL